MAAQLPVEKGALKQVELSELAQVMEAGLRKNFSTASVSVVDCPDLMQPPWNLAAPGICGSVRLADVGGVPYLMPLPQKDKIYNLAEVARMIDLPDALVIGAGAGSSQADSSYETFPYKCTDCGPLANLHFSKGQPGKVIEVRAKIRTGEDDFVSCMRKALLDKYGDDPVGLGGVFQIKSGKAKLHVMPDFSTVPLTSRLLIDQWLKFFDMSSPLTCLSVFITSDPGLDLRLEHTHCFSSHGDGGHYHYDTTPDEVEYVGYFSLAEWMYRVDRPKETHQLGRD